MENINESYNENEIKKTDNQYDNTQSPPDNHLVWAILCTILCCTPIGIVSIIKAVKVNTFWAQGRYEDAKKSASDAKKYAICGAAIAAVFYIFYLLIVIATGSTASKNIL